MEEPRRGRCKGAQGGCGGFLLVSAGDDRRREALGEEKVGDRGWRRRGGDAVRVDRSVKCTRGVPRSCVRVCVASVGLGMDMVRVWGGSRDPIAKRKEDLGGRKKHARGKIRVRITSSV